MPNLDSTAKAAVAGNFAPAWFIYLDIAGDPLRVTTFGADVTFSGTGDSDLDGHTFLAWDVAHVLDLGDVSNGDRGSDTLNITLNGIISIDPTFANEIGDKSKWQGRTARIWFRLYDESGVTPQGALVAYYTGYMSKVPWSAEPELQKIGLEVENYLAFTTQASNRSYLNQKDYDSADTSAAATIAAANGIPHGGGRSPYPNAGTLRGGGGGGGGGDGDTWNRFQGL
jgi:hypothetical protein